MVTMKAIIISDDMLSSKKVINSIDTVKGVDIVKSFPELRDLKEFVSSNEIDVVFVDITSSKKEKINFIQQVSTIKRVLVVLISNSIKDLQEAYYLQTVGFLLKPLKENEIIEKLELIKHMYPFYAKRVEIKTFGNFSVCINGRAIHFPIKKSKEILAYLVNKQGTQVDWPTIAAEVLDEDLYDKTTYNRLHRYIECLKDTLKDYQIENILTCSKGYLSVNTKEFYCDLYAFFNGDQTSKNSYYGEYMYEYSWARSRAAYLDRIINFEK